MKTFTLSLILALLSLTMFAQVNKWTGAANDYAWANPENWSLNEVPNENHDVLFDIDFWGTGADYISATGTVKSITVKKGVQVQFDEGKFEINGTGLVLHVEEGAYLSIGKGSVRYMTPGALAQIVGTFGIHGIYPNTFYDNRNCITRVTGTFQEYDPHNPETASGETVLSTADSFFFEAGSTYLTNTNGGFLPLATWDSSSTCRIEDIVFSFPNTRNQTFGFFEIRLLVDWSWIHFNNSLTCTGDLTITGTTLDWEPEPEAFTFSNVDTNISINVGRDFIIKDAHIAIVKGAGNVDFSVGRDVIMSIDSYYDKLIMRRGSGNAYLKVGRNFFGKLTMAAFPSPVTEAEISGNLNAIVDFSTITNGLGLIRLGGDLEIKTELSESGSGTSSGTLEFNGTRPQLYDGWAVPGTNVNIVVKPGSTLQMNTADNWISGDGNFTLEDNATLGIKHIDGIYKTGAQGTVRVTGTRNFSAKSHYIFNGQAAQKSGNAISSAETITIDNTGGYPLTLTNDSIGIGGKFHLKKGGLNAPAKTLLVGGDWINDAGTDSSLIPAIVFTGDSTSRIGGTKQTAFNHLRLEKNNALTQLLTNSRANGSLSLGSSLALNSYNFTLSDTATAITGINGNLTAAKMIIADSTGELRKEFTSGSALTTYLFPIGNGGTVPAYSPTEIEFTDASGTSGYIGANLRNRKHPDNDYAGAYLKRYWSVNQNGLTDFAVKAGFIYADADVVGTEGDLQLGKWNGAAPWQIFASSVNTGTNYLQSEIINSFSDFTGFSDAVIPPFAFGNLTAESGSGNTVELDFAVSNENEINLYEVERSSGNGTYTKIGEVNPTGAISYEYTDTDPLTGNNVYRIKAIKANNESVYSSTASIEIQGANSGGRVMNVYPNPIPGNRLKILYTDIKPGKYQLIITNSSGNSIYSSKLEVTTTTLQQEIILNGSLPKGIYRVRVSNGTDSYVQTFMK